MLKAVLDTSILVSAFLKPEGVNAKVLLGGKDKYELFLSEDILAESHLCPANHETLLSDKRCLPIPRGGGLFSEKEWQIVNIFKRGCL